MFFENCCWILFSRIFNVIEWEMFLRKMSKKPNGRFKMVFFVIQLLWRINIFFLLNFYDFFFKNQKKLVLKFTYYILWCIVAWSFDNVRQIMQCFLNNIYERDLEFIFCNFETFIWMVDQIFECKTHASSEAFAMIKERWIEWKYVRTFSIQFYHIDIGQKKKKFSLTFLETCTCCTNLKDMKWFLYPFKL